jgi:hypothetical protein
MEMQGLQACGTGSHLWKVIWDPNQIGWTKRRCGTHALAYMRAHRMSSVML